MNKQKFEFPNPISSSKNLKDLLETEVEEKFFIPQEKVNALFTKKSERISGWKETEEKIYAYGKKKGNHLQECVYNKPNSKNISAVTAVRPPQVILQLAGILNIKGHDLMKRVYDPNGISPSVNTMQSGNTQPKILLENCRIRKLTPLECMRLMGFNDEDYHKLKANKMSNSQIYKVCGNSIVVNVLEEIFKKLFPGDIRNCF